MAGFLATVMKLPVLRLRGRCCRPRYSTHITSVRLAALREHKCSYELCMNTRVGTAAAINDCHKAAYRTGNCKLFTVLLFHSVVATLLTCERGTRYQCGTGTYTDLPLFLEANATVSTLSGLLTARRSVARRTGLSDGDRLVWVLSRKQITVTLSLLTHFTEGVSLGPLTLHKMGLKEIGVDGNVVLKWVLKKELCMATFLFMVHITLFPVLNQ